MLIEIKCRFSAKVLYSGDHENTKKATEAAVRSGVSLAGANLADADLADANLADANLAGANLARADLADANLAGANLARADLARADLTGVSLAGANLADADLADANLADANLAGANLARADLARADLTGADLTGAKGYISNSHELLAQIAVRFDDALRPVAAMIAGRLVGCWSEYTDTIRSVFGEDVMQRLWQAWSQDDSWGIAEKMGQHGWPAPEVEQPHVEATITEKLT